MNKGLLIVISGPSGAGKGTIYNAVIDNLPNIKKSISVTTRLPRNYEVNGVHYHFKTLQEYQQMIANGEFLETAEVYNNFYGTPKAPIFKMLDNGDDVMFEVDILGAKQIKNKYSECISIFIMTPSFEILENRLRNRKTDTEDSIRTRLGSARRELGEYKHFDYIVFNDDAVVATKKVIDIINSEKNKIAINEDIIQGMLNGK